MSEVTEVQQLETRIKALEEAIKNVPTISAIESALRRIWKEDVQVALRHEKNDVTAHVKEHVAKDLAGHSKELSKHRGELTERLTQAVNNVNTIAGGVRNELTEQHNKVVLALNNRAVQVWDEYHDMIQGIVYSVLEKEGLVKLAKL